MLPGKIVLALYINNTMLQMDRIYIVWKLLAIFSSFVASVASEVQALLGAVTVIVMSLVPTGVPAAMMEIARKGGPRSPRSTSYSSLYTCRLICSLSSTADRSVMVRPLPGGANDNRINLSAASSGGPRVPFKENPDRPPETITDTFVSPCSETPVRGFNRPGGPNAVVEKSSEQSKEQRLARC